MSFRVEKATPNDAAALGVLAAKTYTETFGYLYRPEDLACHLEAGCSEEFFKEALKKDVVFVIRDRGQLIAYAKVGKVGLPIVDCDPAARELHRIYIDTSYQHKGLGAMLMEEILSLDMMRQAPQIYLGVWENNFKAQRFYTRYGFRPIGEYQYMVGKHSDRDLIYARVRQDSLL